METSKAVSDYGLAVTNGNGYAVVVVVASCCEGDCETDEIISLDHCGCYLAQLGPLNRHHMQTAPDWPLCTVKNGVLY